MYSTSTMVLVERRLLSGRLASFLDRQFDDTLQDKLTFEENGKRYAVSYQIPKCQADIQKRGDAFYEWATWSNGMFGRTPDYKNASVMAFAAAAEFLAEDRNDFADNMRNYYEFVGRHPNPFWWVGAKK